MRSHLCLLKQLHAPCGELLVSKDRTVRINTPKGIRAFQRCVLQWHEANKRDFPWRRTHDPYHILVAEVLLQQTDAPKVLPVYSSFIERFASVEDLAQADPAEVSALLSPLGLRYRAQRLIAIAQHVVHDYGGHVPDSEEMLLRLPGVGRYVARSVCAAAFGQRKGVLDTNIIRILDRCFGIRSSRRRPREDSALWDLVNRLVPPRTLAEPAKWNWALLDFAASLCTHYKPACEICVIKFQCGCTSDNS